MLPSFKHIVICGCHAVSVVDTANSLNCQRSIFLGISDEQTCFWVSRVNPGGSNSIKLLKLLVCHVVMPGILSTNSQVVKALGLRPSTLTTRLLVLIINYLFYLPSIEMFRKAVQSTV